MGHTVKGSLCLQTQGPYVMAVDGTVKAWPVDPLACRIHIATAGNTPIIQGIAGGVDTRLLIILNSSGVSVLFQNQGISGPNRIILQTADFYLVTLKGMMLWYDADAAGWRMISGNL
jgi:hypothetical protein